MTAGTFCGIPCIGIPVTEGSNAGRRSRPSSPVGFGPRVPTVDELLEALAHRNRLAALVDEDVPRGTAPESSQPSDLPGGRLCAFGHDSPLAPGEEASGSSAVGLVIDQSAHDALDGAVQGVELSSDGRDDPSGARRSIRSGRRARSLSPEGYGPRLPTTDEVLEA